MQRGMEASTAALRRAPPLPGLIRLGLLGALLALAAVGWIVTDERMDGMDTGPGADPGTLGFWVTAWVVMMAAMMFPSVAPTVMMYAHMRRGSPAQARLGGTAAFAAGYLCAWAAAGLVGYAVLRAGHELSPGFLAWDAAGAYVAGAVILAAALYQLTPLKDVCLSRCRNPFVFVMTAWRPGRSGALRMGIEHGAWCVGCCWALMAALIAVGVMSVGWMAFVAALIALEKLLPWKAVANRSIALLLVALALAVAFVPEEVPGLTTPGDAMGSEPGHGAMPQSHMDH